MTARPQPPSGETDGGDGWAGNGADPGTWKPESRKER